MPVSSNLVCVYKSFRMLLAVNMGNAKDWIWYAGQGKKKTDLNFLRKHSLGAIVNSLNKGGHCKLNLS